MWRLVFTHPAALWLSAGAVLPLMIHLLSRQKPRVVRFPAVRFILQSRRRTIRRTRLRQILLLLLRMALIALFALAIARPAVTKGDAGVAEGAEEGTPAAVFVLDDSLSMSYLEGDTTWFDTARSRALDMVRNLRPGTAAAVITSSRPQGRLMRQPDELMASIQGLRVGTRAGSCWFALQNAARMLSETGASQRDIVLLTDMTRGAWLGYERRVADLGKNVRLHVVDCAPDGGENAAVYGVEHQGEPPMLGALLEVEARVGAAGTSHSRTIQFAFDGAVVQRSTVELKAGEETRVRFNVPLEESGHHYGEVAFLNPDGLPLDDGRRFTVEVEPDVSVLCVEDNPTSTAGSRSHFLRLALNPWRQAGRGVFRVQRTSPRELAEYPLAPIDVVVLAGAGQMTDEAWTRLTGFVAGGGGLFVFLGPETGSAYASESAQRVLPGSMGDVVVAPEDGPFRIRTLKVDHPLVAAVTESGAEMAEARTFRCREFLPADDAETLLGFGPDHAALVIRELGGRTAVFTSTPDEVWTDLPTTPAYVPLCHETVLYLARRRASSLDSFTTGASVPITFEPSRWPTVVYVTPPGAQSPERLLPGTTPGKLTFWQTDTPGYYAVTFEQRGELRSDGFAVNTSPVESRLEKVSLDDVRGSIKAAGVEMLDRRRIAEGGRLSGLAGGGEVTPLVILLALVVLLAEGLLANRFYGASEPGPESAA